MKLANCRSCLKSTVLFASLLSLPFSSALHADEESDLRACIQSAKGGFLEVPDDPSKRFLGKVEEDTARCRGGEKAARLSLIHI